MSEFTLPEAGGDTNIIICICHLYEVGRFSYNESPRTPPLDGTSLHRWNNIVERPWGIWACFTTFSWLRVISACQRLYVTQTCRVFVDQTTWSSSFFLPWISAGREGWGYPSIFPISNGCHTSTWHTSELNKDHVLGNNTWTCGLRSILKHNPWGYTSL